MIWRSHHFLKQETNNTFNTFGCIMTRRVTIQTPLGDALNFRELKGREELSQVFSLDIDLLSERGDNYSDAGGYRPSSCD